MGPYFCCWWSASVSCCRRDKDVALLGTSPRGGFEHRKPDGARVDGLRLEQAVRALAFGTVDERLSDTAGRTTCNSRRHLDQAMSPSVILDVEAPELLKAQLSTPAFLMPTIRTCPVDKQRNPPQPRQLRDRQDQWRALRERPPLRRVRVRRYPGSASELPQPRINVLHIIVLVDRLEERLDLAPAPPASSDTGFFGRQPAAPPSPSTPAPSAPRSRCRHRPAP